MTLVKNSNHFQNMLIGFSGTITHINSPVGTKYHTQLLQDLFNKHSHHWGDQTMDAVWFRNKLLVGIKIYRRYGCHPDIWLRACSCNEVTENGSHICKGYHIFMDSFVWYSSLLVMYTNYIHMWRTVLEERGFLGQDWSWWGKLLSQKSSLLKTSMLHHSDYGFSHVFCCLQTFSLLFFELSKNMLKVENWTILLFFERERMFSEVLGVLKRPPTVQITAMDSFRNDSKVCPEFFNTAETHLVGDDSDHPHRPYSSALSHVLLNCLSL